MTILISLCIAVIFAVSVYLLLGRELKGVAIGVFLLSHGAHLGIIAMSGQPLARADGEAEPLGPPILTETSQPVDPLPQALVLTSIVISFAVMAFLLTLLVVTHRRAEHLVIDELAEDDRPRYMPGAADPASS